VDEVVDEAEGEQPGAGGEAARSCAEGARGEARDRAALPLPLEAAPQGDDPATMKATRT